MSGTGRCTARLLHVCAVGDIRPGAFRRTLHGCRIDWNIQGHRHYRTIYSLGHRPCVQHQAKRKCRNRQQGNRGSKHGYCMGNKHKKENPYYAQKILSGDASPCGWWGNCVASAEVIRSPRIFSHATLALNSAKNRLHVLIVDRLFLRSIHLVPVSRKPGPPRDTATTHNPGCRSIWSGSS